MSSLVCRETAFAAREAIDRAGIEPAQVDHRRAPSLRAGFEAHVTKPVEPQELAAAVASLARFADLRARLIRTDSLSPAQQSCALKHWQAHVLADQRGCGQSTPTAELAGNTTPNLIADLDALAHTGLLPMPVVILLPARSNVPSSTSFHAVPRSANCRSS